MDNVPGGMEFHNLVREGDEEKGGSSTAQLVTAHGT